MLNNFRTLLLSSVCALALSPAQAENTNVPPTDPAALAEWLETVSGQILVHESGAEFTYANPPGTLWQLSNVRTIDAQARLVHRDGMLLALWDDGEVTEHAAHEPLPFTVSKERLPVADHWAAIIGNKLLSDVGPLPKGTVLTPRGGITFPNESTTAKWSAIGDRIQITGDDFEPQSFNLQTLFSAVSVHKRK